MLTGDEQVWKEVQESLKKIEELKAHWSILFTHGLSCAVGWLPYWLKPGVSEAEARV